MTRAEHIRWCKQRAREYLDANDPAQAVASMLSDLRKHDETSKLCDSVGMLGIMSAGSLREARKFIEGFRE